MARIAIRDTFRLTANVRIARWRRDDETGLWRPDGYEEGHNLVVNAGLNFIRDLLGGATTGALTHLAVGTGSTAVAAGDTALGTEVFRDVLTQRITTTAVTLILKYYLGTTSANGNTLREAGLFNASTSGTMFARYVLASSIVKTVSVQALFQWQINLSAS